MAQQGNLVKELKQIYDILGYPPAQRVLWFVVTKNDILGKSIVATKEKPSRDLFSKFNNKNK